MPKLYEYLGIIIYFYSNEHKPIHVHGKKGGKESKAEITFSGGSPSVNVKAHKGGGLEKVDLKNFENFVKKSAKEIADSWFQYFVKGKKPLVKKITKKV